MDYGPFRLDGVEIEEETTPRASAVGAHLVDEVAEETTAPVRLAPGFELPSESGTLRAWLRRLSDDDLDRLALAVYEVRRDKAVSSGDLEAKLAEAFRTAFEPRSGLGVMPWIEHGVLWCPGSRQDSSQTKHDCRFVWVDGVAAWEHPDQFRDEIRRTDQGANKMSMRSITLIPVDDGAEVDVVTSVSRNGLHQRKRVDSFVVAGGELERTGRRNIAADGHR